MKKLLFMLAIAVRANVGAQSVTPEEVNMIQDIQGKSKLEVVKEYLNLSDVQGAAFQEVYDKYELERKGNLNNLDMEKLLSKTHGRMKKAIGGINAAKFVQLEQYLQITIRVAIQDAIPFIDELDKNKIKQ